MYYVYILYSKSLDQYYTGFSQDLKERLSYHKSHQVKTTSRKDDYTLVWYCAFDSKVKALLFERYLKKGSGFAFRNKYFI
ncbi:MAG TPA: GIY-YIG nuclease family protein [Candidatus Paceibacterota bacterium]|nr:GIY-YIG nuclease family protein [Candidatus Paceibacterota bacterium]